MESIAEDINDIIHYVYIIQSEKDGRYYIGSTHDPELRLVHHNKGWTRSTKSRVPWKLKYIEKYKNKKMALHIEREIKAKKSREYIKRLIAAEGRPDTD